MHLRPFNLAMLTTYFTVGRNWVKSKKSSASIPQRARHASGREVLRSRSAAPPASDQHEGGYQGWVRSVRLLQYARDAMGGLRSGA